MKTEYILVKKEDEFCNSIDSFNNLLKTNSQIQISKGKIQVESSDAFYIVDTELTDDKKERLFFVEFNTEETDERKSVEILESVNRCFRKVLKESGKQIHINIIWDEISHYYCKITYPSINEVENLMRKLIFKFMIKNVGSDWVERAFPEKLRQSITDTAKKNNITSLLENSLYEADFSQLVEFLFTPYSPVNGIKDFFDKIGEIKDASDFERVKEFKPKSNWERYFSAIIDSKDIDSVWTELYKLRNKVAHNKLVTRSDYEATTSKSAKLKSILVDALKKLNKVKVPEKDKNTVSRAAIKSIEAGSISISGSAHGSGYASGTLSLAIRGRCDFCSKELNGNGEVSFGRKYCPDCYSARNVLATGTGITFTSNPTISLSSLAGPISISRDQILGTSFSPRHCRNCGKEISSVITASVNAGLCSDCSSGPSTINVYQAK